MNKLNIKFILTFIFFYTLTFVKAEKHPFSPQDLINVKKIGSHSISPNSQYMLYDVNKYIQEKNKKQQNIFIINLKTQDTVQLTSDHTDLSPFWLNDNTIAFLSDRSGSIQLWYSPLDFENLGLLKNKTMVQLTEFSTDINNFIYNEKANRLLFSAQSFVNGTMVNDETYVEHEENQHTTGMVYDKLFIRHWDTFLRPAVREQLFVVDFENKDGKFSVKNEPVNIMQGKEMESPVAPFGDAGDFAISPDGETIAFSSRVEEHSQAWNTNTNIYLVKYPVGGKPGDIENLTSSNPGYDTIPNFSPDGQYLSYFEMREKSYESDTNRLMLYNLKSKSHTELALKWDRSPDSLTWSPDSSKLYLTAASLGRNKIYVAKLDDALKTLKVNKKANKVPSVPLVVKELVGTGSSDSIEIIQKGKLENNAEEILVFCRSTMKQPREIFKLEVLPWEKLQVENEARKVMIKPPQSEASLTQISKLNTEFDDEVQVSEPEEFYFKGHGNELVQGWLLKPVNFDQTKKYPLAFLIHGGPQGSWDDSFGSRWNVQSYAGAGYVVVAINFHGSVGFGEKFERAVSKNWGNGPYNDLMKSLDYVLKTYKFINKKKICGLGASFGGYMVNWINGHTDRFACLVNHDGIFDTQSTYFTTEELFFTEYEFGGTPWDQKAKKLYQKWNPREHIKKWKTPTLVIHGGKDYRLSESEGIATFTALQRLGIKSRLLYFPDENHWVLKPSNVLFWYQNIFEWLELFTKDN
ncbi:hypothetical protein BCR32DRAFT_264806 [Anaeromyces robustus]|uniref:Dipeptidyl-peptidase V n=1 Tax=Anaeromyces robustus TaxID=1754192 RepID=A0A1Y1XM58_9FUNG|nr:hypothetical protein BCR32DRAFT_264806 [Anaeromyces robustus]|eukprot:ORX86783.1 hypothetical protein BCR32DRAFT_264806 [Anaeromyces robustus]